MTKAMTKMIVALAAKNQPNTLPELIELVKREFGEETAAEFWDQSLNELLSNLTLLDVINIAMEANK